MSTHLQDNEPVVNASGGMKVALIGPNEAYRKIVAKALAGSDARSVREFVDYPANLADLPAMLDQHFDVIMIDVDSDESYAIKLVEAVAAITKAIVMVYSRRNDPDLLMNCMRAGARDFLPLPQEPQPETSVSGPHLVQPESHLDARPVPPAVSQPVAQPEPRPVPVASAPSYTMAPPEPRPVPTPAAQSFSAPPSSLEPPAYVPAIDRDVPEQRIDEFPLRSSFTEMGQPHSLQHDIDEWDEAHLRAPAPAATNDSVLHAHFAAEPAPPATFRPEPATFRAPEPAPFHTPEPASFRASEPPTFRVPEPAPFRAPEPPKAPAAEEAFPIEAFLKTPEPAKPVAPPPVESFLRTPEPQAKAVAEPRRAESGPMLRQPKQEPAAAPAPESSFDDWDSAFLRTPQSPANKGVSGSPRATVTSIPRPQPVPAPAPKAPEPPPAAPASLFGLSAPPETASVPADTSVLSASRPQLDRESLPKFHYEVPEEEKQAKSNVGLWAAIAGGAGIAACAVAFFVLKPFHHEVPAAAPQAQSQQAAQQASTAWQPVNPAPAQQQAAPTAPVAKPSAATPIAGAPVQSTTVAANSVSVSAGMMDAQLAAPSRIRGEVKNVAAPEEAPPTGFTPVSLDNGGANLSGFGGEKKVTVLPGVHAISSGVAEGMLIRKIDPVYPKFAKDSHISGTVVLQATISKSGAIQGLQVVRGPQILGQAAVSAVRNWRYRPYMLNDEPVDVQTTINVVFNLAN